MSEERVPAERFPLSEYLREELEARGWKARDLAIMMLIADYPVTLLTVELHLAIDDPDRHLGKDTASRLGAALGVDPDLLLRLDESSRGPVSGGALSEERDV